MVHVHHARRGQRPDLSAQPVVARQQLAERDFGGADDEQHRRLAPVAAPFTVQPPKAQLRCTPVLAVERVVEHLDVGILQGEAELGADLEVVGHDPGVVRHLRAQRAHFAGQHAPAGEIAGVPLLRGRMRAQRGDRDRHVVPEDRHQPERGGRVRRATPSPRPRRQHRRQQRQQQHVAGQRPVEAHALGVCEEAEHEEAEHDQRAGQREQPPHRPRVAAMRPRRDRQCRQQQRRDQQRLDGDEPGAVGMERPGVAVDQLEAQPGLGVLHVPGDQRRPRRGAQRQRDQHARIAQQPPAFGQPQQHEEAHRDHRDEAVMAECADRQAQRQFHRASRIDRAQQPCHRVHA